MPSKKTNLMRYCPMCNIELEASNFITSKNPHHNGYLLYCKNHCNQIFKENLKKNSNLATAMYFTCAETGIPFVYDIFKAYETSRSEKIEKRQNEINPDNGKKKYSATDMKKYIEEYKDFSFYADALRKTNSGLEDWSTFESGTNVDFKDINKNIKTVEEITAEKEKFILDWGYQDDIDDYSFLEYVYDELTDGKALSKPQEMLYRDLCIARLKKRKIDSGELKEEDSAKVQKQILDLMQKLKIDNFMEEKNKSDIDKILEKQIWEIENEEPAELVDKEEYKDFLGIGNTWYNHILRAVRNLVSSSKEFPDVTKDEWN